MIHSSLRKGFAFLVGLGAAAGVVSTSAPASALPWGQLLFQGIQLFQLSHLSTQQKVQVGQDIHQQVLQNYQLDHNAQTNAYVNRVGQRVAAASDCSQYPFHFYVVQDQNINAFSTTGGYVYVNSGLIKAADNEDQLAGVIGHEIGHICDNDLVNHMEQSTLAQGVASLAGLDRSTIANIGYQLAFELPHSRQDEFNADTQGLKYMQRAGYNPTAMPAFLSKLLRYPSPPTFLSDHPATRDRIAALQQQIAASHATR
jgi:predicted Zn-dependent protease